MKHNILVVVAHPDDETLGAGGTLRKHVLDGDTVNVMSMTDGVGAREDGGEKEANNRLEAAKEASNIIGFNWIENYNFEDNALDTYPNLEIIKAIEKIKNDIDPNIVYTHSGADLNIDHRIIAKSVLTAFRPQPNETCNEIRLFEVPSATDYGHESITGNFSPNLFIDINETWETKELALNAYQSEIRNYPHSRSIKAISNLGEIRGNQVGLHMAEAFQVIRKIIH